MYAPETIPGKLYEALYNYSVEFDVRDREVQICNINYMKMEIMILLMYWQKFLKIEELMIIISI